MATPAGETVDPATPPGPVDVDGTPDSEILKPEDGEEGDSGTEPAEDTSEIDGGTEEPDASPPVDDESPAWADGATLEVLVQSATEVVLTWQPATDPSGIASYILFQDDIEHTQVEGSTNLLAVQDLPEGTAIVFQWRRRMAPGTEPKTVPR